jgi:hypothetical protein
LLELVEDVELRRRMGKQALQDAQSYTIDAIATDWEQLLHHAGAGPRPLTRQVWRSRDR